MATLILNSSSVSKSCAIFYRNGIEYKPRYRYSVMNGYIEDGKDIIQPQRVGYKRTINDVILFHFHEKPDYDDFLIKHIWDHHTTPEELYKFFGYDINNLSGEIVIDNIDPWICYTEDNYIALYFGKDKPILKTKTSKIETKHMKMWSKHTDAGKPYKYWDVKDKSKLLFCSETSMDKVFPEIPWRLYEPHGKLKCVYIGPFRASDPYDYFRK